MNPMIISLILSGLGLGGQALSSIFGKKEIPGQYGQQSSAIPEQSQALKQMLNRLPMQQGMEAIQGQLSGQNQAGENALMRQFREQTMPDIAEQYAGMGALGSSGFNQQMAQSGERLAETLGAQRANIQQQGISNLLNLFGQGMGAKTTFPTYTPPQQSTAQNLSPIFGQVAGAGLGMLENKYLMDLLKKTGTGVN